MLRTNDLTVKIKFELLTVNMNYSIIWLRKRGTVMFFYFDDEHPYAEPTVNTLGIYRVRSLNDYMKAQDQLSKLKQLYDGMEQKKDKESEVVAEAVQEQEKQLDIFAGSIDVFDSKYLSNNIEHLLKREHMKVSDLETLLNVSAGYISRTMGADSKKRISIDIVWMIASLFKVNIDDFLNRDLATPTKDLKKVMAFIDKLKEDTDQENIHWKTLGSKPMSETKMLFRKTEDGDFLFGPNDETDDFCNVKDIYQVYINIGSVYLVSLEDMIFGTESYRIYVFDEDTYRRSIGSEYELHPLYLMYDTTKDITDLLLKETDKLVKAIKTHEHDYIISNEARSLIDQYLYPQEPDIDEDVPF